MKNSREIAEKANELRLIYSSDKENRIRRDLAFAANHALLWALGLIESEPVQINDDVVELREKHGPYGQKPEALV